MTPTLTLDLLNRAIVLIPTIRTPSLSAHVSSACLTRIQLLSSTSLELVADLRTRLEVFKWILPSPEKK